jgi:hypothetical protein
MKNFVRTLAHLFIFVFIFVSPTGFEFPSAKQRAKMPLSSAIVISITGLAIVSTLVYFGLQAVGLW